ncbi:uncharacterized protein PHACADRAFT_194236 [Phanerochaete carnosa HHB-10118-sp]|uniref:Uncharacterized protein n=1 Tax=Phanerochaete carnosa (strain HHB-10118-sp) TaxID=650164 RepID=K5WCA8_PHACS|nr:uncharacterized protein PHACADRAFT_194236 [Phanerochaete carnosa HHB-10118-sp]EKM56644.1 hypothetical protein PHACADRAFT_194236 [Phanerochaete carnosa HHB-10118-sp]
MLVLTWIKTFGHWKGARRLDITVPLTTCLLRDGTFYFIALLATNIAQLLTFDPADPMSALIKTLPLILINRFMINLRAASQETTDCSVCIADLQQAQSTLQFRRSTSRLGNIGGTLRDAWDDESWNQEDDSAAVEDAGCLETGAEP